MKKRASVVSRKPCQPATSVTLRPDDLCKRWGVSLRTLERRIEDGVVPKPLMLGGRRWFLASIEEFEKRGSL